MSWIIVNNNGQFCVHIQNADGSAGERVEGACHPTEQAAADQIAALQANEPAVKAVNLAAQFLETALDLDEASAEQALGEMIKLVKDAGSATSLKALDDAGRIGGYLVIWGSPEQRDLQGEYFTPETELGLDWYEQRPVLYHHGLDGSLKAAVIGAIDTLHPDETGLWAEAQLDLRQRYVRTIQKLVERGILGWSSGSLPHLAVVDKDGRIKHWPIVEGSLTPAPAEPRKTDVHTIKTAYADLGLDPTRLELPSESQFTDAQNGEPPPKEPVKAEEAGNARTGVDDPNSQLDNEQSSKGTEMSNIQEVIMALIQALMSAGVQISEEQQTQAAQQVMSAIQADPATSPLAAAPVEPAQFTEVAKAIAPKVKAVLDAMFAEIEGVRNALTLAAKGAVGDLVGSGGSSRAPGFQLSGQGQGSQGGQGQGRGKTNITVKTIFHDYSAQDMAFYYQLRNPKGERGWTPDQKFFRELADKAQKSIDDGTLRYLPEPGYIDDDENAPIRSAIKAVSAIKSDELDYSTQAGFGDDWVPDLWRSEIWLRVRRDNVVAQQFQIWDMPSNPWNVPLEGADPTLYRVAETTSENQLTLADANSPIPDSKIGTEKNQLFAYKLGLRVPLSAELEEDTAAILQVIPQFREQAMRTILDGIDYVLLNADNTIAGSPSGNINRYDAATLTSDKDKWLLGWDGMLHQPLVDNTLLKIDAGAAAPTLQMFRAVQSTLDEEYLDDTDNLVWLVDALTHQKMKGINEFLTMDKFGSKATILTGQVGALDGVPVLVSSQVKRADTNGKISVTPANNVRGRASLIYKPYQVVGYRRRIKTWVKFYEEYDSYQMGATVRIAFKRRDNSAGVGLLYNILV